MKRQVLRAGLVSLMFGVFIAQGSFSGGAVFAEENETEVVRAAAGEFYIALNALFTGDIVPMRKVWSHKDDVTYMGPGGGFRLGWKEVSADWESQAALKLGGKVEPKDMRITVGKDLAIVSNYEVGQNVVGGTTQKVTIRATNLFRKENGRWKMIGHHTDILPFLQK